MNQNLAAFYYSICLDKKQKCIMKNKYLSEVGICMAKVLIIEDDVCIRELLSLYLKHSGYEVIEAGSGEEGLEILKQTQFTIIILDIMLPGIDGISLCKKIRKQNSTPIIMLTAKNDEDDKVIGLDAGADDYLTKPFGPKELLARIRALLRRTNLKTEETREETRNYRFKDFEVNIETRTVIIQGSKVTLPGKEFDLLVLFVTSHGRVFTREQILNKIWGFDYFGDTRTVDVHVQRLRKKIEPNPDQPTYIKTVWGFGYRFEGDLC